MEHAITQQRALEIVFEAVDEVNEMLSDERKLEKRSDVVLVGDFGKLDSLGLVSFIAAVEGAGQRHLGQDLCLADQMATTDGPLSSIGSLAEYISQRAVRNEQ